MRADRAGVPDVAPRARLAGRPGAPWRSELDAQDLALPGTEAEPVVRDVERPVGADRHAGRERQAGDHRRGRAV